jgi:hypothetical protein
MNRLAGDVRIEYWDSTFLSLSLSLSLGLIPTMRPAATTLYAFASVVSIKFGNGLSVLYDSTVNPADAARSDHCRFVRSFPGKEHHEDVDVVLDDGHFVGLFAGVRQHGVHHTTRTFPSSGRAL